MRKTCRPSDYWTAHCVKCCADVDLRSKDPAVVKAHAGHLLLLSEEMAFAMAEESLDSYLLASIPLSLN